jgi:tetratricopeptide (TPR) repeat protein
MRTKQIRVKLECRWAQMTPQEALRAAVTLHRAGKTTDAERIFNTVLRYSPVSSQELIALGGACYAFGRYEDALRHYEVVAAREPRNADVRSDMGVVLSALGRFQEAATVFEEALTIRPDSARIHSNYGDLLTDMQRYEEAKAHCHKALELQPGYAEALNNLGRVLDLTGQRERAGEAYRKALAAKPDLMPASFNLGGLAHLADRPVEAAAHYERASAASEGDAAEVRYNLSLHLLRNGEFERGLELYESRWNCRSLALPPRGFSQPLWDGRDSSGKTILLHAEQGIGDTIQFARYAPLAAARSGRVLLEVQPELAGLMKDLAGVNELVVQNQPLPRFDVHCPLLSLPRVMGTRLESIPADIPYLRPEPALAGYWAGKLSAEKLRVGLVWAGNPEHKNDKRRSLPLDAFKVLSDVDGVAWFSLQKEPAREQLRVPPAGMQVEDLGPYLDSFADTAAVLANLDLLLSADTAIVHLAGALGRPVWTLIPYTPDWRWLTNREDSPWYPTMRLFRQFKPSGWDEVMLRVKKALLAKVDEHEASKGAAPGVYFTSEMESSST